MKKLLLALPVVFLLAAGCNNSSTASPSTQSNQPSAITQGQANAVSYTDSGFLPSTLTIKKGESVIFTNNSFGGMSVASNPHPTHTDYPEFDQYKSSQRGNKAYTFTFEKSGTWGYHNHLNPSDGGTIVVQ